MINYRQEDKNVSRVQKTLVMSALLLMAVDTYSFAQVQVGSNLGASGYPSHSCAKPVIQKPSAQESFKDQAELDQYNRGVDVYNVELKKYVSCIKKYIADSYRDIESIKESAQAAIDEASKLK